jgi:hypothetical protein
MSFEVFACDFIVRTMRLPDPPREGLLMTKSGRGRPLVHRDRTDCSGPPSGLLRYWRRIKAPSLLKLGDAVAPPACATWSRASFMSDAQASSDGSSWRSRCCSTLRRSCSCWPPRGRARHDRRPRQVHPSNRTPPPAVISGMGQSGRESLSGTSAIGIVFLRVAIGTCRSPEIFEKAAGGQRLANILEFNLTLGRRTR